MKKSILTTIVLTLFALATKAQAPPTTAVHSVKVVAASVLEVVMTSTADVVFDFLTTANYDNGITKTNATELKVKSTKPWTIKAQGGAANFNKTVGNPNDIPLTALTIGSGGSFLAINNTSGTTIKDGPKGGNGTSGNTFSLDYRMNPGYVQQDTYDIAVTYTISQN